MSGLTLSQKILSAHQQGSEAVRPGQFIKVAVDWVMSSELSLNGMMLTYEQLNNPDLHDPNSFYLAIDHTVDPVSLRSDPATIELAQQARRFARDRRIPAFYDANETIMHTRFYREHGVPGQVVLGADSHTTSHGALGAFAFGLGGRDVAVASVTGATWLQVPEAISVSYEGVPPFGITGKDVVLRTLKDLGSNGAALEKIVEYRIGDPASMTIDTRFTICNMTAELGGFTGVFTPDAMTQAFLTARGRFSAGARYFRADEDADYADRWSIDLHNLAPQVAKPFSPDNVFDVAAVAGQALDGCFIGACTTTEEEIILGALVLEAMARQGVTAAPSGKRLVVPGDLEMRDRLERLGLWDIYRAFGFRVGVPGCHLCLGIGSERAGAGEVWLSSQNRNYRNRMGKGSVAWLASAATVAASSADLRVTDPRQYLAAVDPVHYRALIGADAPVLDQPRYADVAGPRPVPIDQAQAGRAMPKGEVRGRSLCFGDNIDTDAIIPGEFCGLRDWAEVGQKCFAYLRPDVPERCAKGQTIIVAGLGWGCGSSRENAAWALVGAGFKAVIARSFGSIHRRNLINEGLPTILLEDDRFYAEHTEGDTLVIDLAAASVRNCRTDQVYFGSMPKGIAGEILGAGGVIAHLQAQGRVLEDVGL